MLTKSALPYDILRPQENKVYMLNFVNKLKLEQNYILPQAFSNAACIKKSMRDMEQMITQIII